SILVFHLGFLCLYLIRPGEYYLKQYSFFIKNISLSIFVKLQNFELLDSLVFLDDLVSTIQIRCILVYAYKYVHDI
ncbi:hypothetical protein VIGAN_01286500, partial [Vigna angularis var. angularis]